MSRGSDRRAGTESPASPGTPVPALAAAARAGDRVAFGHLYERLAPMVHGVLLSWARPDDADDLLQEVFLAAWRSIGSLRDDAHVGAWVATIARHAAHRHHRRAPPAPTPLPADVVDGAPADGAGRLESEEILALVATLPGAYRETLVLRLVEGLSGPEIAALTGLTPDSVRVNLSRGMKQLRHALERKGWS